MTIDHLPLTAVHESGHVVAYLAHGLGFRYVTIRSRNALGTVALHRPRPTDARALAIVSVAGSAAELLEHYEHDALAVLLELRDRYDEALQIDLTNDGDWSDVGDRDELLQGDTLYQPIGQTIERTIELLSERWADVRAIADALLSSPRRLSYADCVAIVGSNDG